MTRRRRADHAAPHRRGRRRCRRARAGDRLGDKLGKRNKADITLVERARTHLWKPLLHEVAAGSMDVDDHALDYLAQAHWHHFRYRFGEMIGLDRAKREVCLAATYDEEGTRSRPRARSTTTRW